MLIRNAKTIKLQQYACVSMTLLANFINMSGRESWRDLFGKHAAGHYSTDAINRVPTSSTDTSVRCTGAINMSYISINGLSTETAKLFLLF
jgi:hypothetical protein